MNTYELLKSDRAVDVYTNKDVVLHIVNKVSINNEVYLGVLNQYRYAQNLGDIAIYMSSIPLSDNIIIPKTINCGESDSSYWKMEEYLDGQTFTESKQIIELDTFREVIFLCRNLHQSKNRLIKDKPLINFYDDRLEALKSLDQKMPDVYFDLADKLLKNISNCIGENDKIANIHGDLNGSNLIYMDKKTGIIDFEQGLYGGDPFADLDKLLQLEISLYPPLNINKLDYDPKLTMNEKFELINQYFDSLNNLKQECSRIDDIEILNLRHNLIYSESILRALFSRYFLDYIGIEALNYEIVDYMESLIGDVYERF